MESAVEDGYVRWLSPTRVDPGCYDREVELDYSPVRYDDMGIHPIEAGVRAYVGLTTIFERVYTAEGPDIEWEAA